MKHTDQPDSRNHHTLQADWQNAPHFNLRFESLFLTYRLPQLYGNNINSNSTMLQRKTVAHKQGKTWDKLATTVKSAALAKKLELLSKRQIFGHSFWNAGTGGGSEAHSTILDIHTAAPDCTTLFCSPMASNKGLTNSPTTLSLPPPPLSLR